MTRWVEETFHPHWRVRLEASRVLHEVKTEHMHLVIFVIPTWGTVLMLDGVCQLTTSDEFVYHEMMAHVPLMVLARPRRVLVVGGGDGGVLVTQNGLPFLFPEHLRATTEIFASLFVRAAPYLCTQPCYFGGPFALNWASDDDGLLDVAEATLTQRVRKRGIATRYYTPAVHKAAFALPGYVAEAIAGVADGRAGKSAAHARKRRRPKVR